MKILYISVFLDGTGYSQAAIDYALALDSVGVDLVLRNEKLNDYHGKVPERISQLLSNDTNNVTHVIQHILPNMMIYDGNFYNIGLYASETSNFKNSVWADRLNLMDEIWVINNQMVDAAKKSFVDKKINVIPHASDINKFDRSYKNYHIDKIKELKESNNFIFYFIGEMNRRKNITALIKAFYIEFQPYEPVEIVLKINKPGTDKEVLKEEASKAFNEIRNGLKLPYYKNINIITDRLNESQLMYLHETCDAFVCPSYGEAWCIPAFDAMGFGKTPIVTASGGFLEYISNDEGWLTDCRQEPVFGMFETYNDLYTGEETWSSIDIKHLCKNMRECYENHELRKQKSLAGLAKVDYFSHKSIGKKMLKVFK